MSQKLATPKSGQHDGEARVDHLTRRSAAQLAVTASAGGSAEVTQLKSLREVQDAHPHIAKLVDLKKALHAPTAAPLPTTIGPFNTNSITFHNGVPVGGFASLTLHSDGTCQFSGHFHVSGAPSYKVEFAWVVVDSGGNAYTFTASGKVHGTFESGSRDFNWNKSQVSPAIKQNWSKLAAGWHWQWSAHVNWDMQAAVNSVISGIKAAGQVVGAVVEVVAIVA
ncbi:MAG TPA: hypothetical protein VKI00_00145 [Mycobacterium sp.]|uniref:hypothetical protein n=1 Tax=Mycobacterium sp. TaxID=1785 RepID=UPI002C33DEFF|nr:hypothetical protein [Mycobacterium sp.]HME74107.1 hypothetical protein [Mycobacterium sp.]